MDGQQEPKTTAIPIHCEIRLATDKQFISVGEALKVIPELIGEKILRQDHPDIQWEEAPEHALYNAIQRYATKWRSELETALKDGSVTVIDGLTRIRANGKNILMHYDLIPINSLVEWGVLHGIAITMNGKPEHKPEPEIESASSTSIKNTIANEKRCKEWLINLMSGNSRPEKNRPEYQTEAKEKFPGLTTRAFMRAWGDAITQTENANWAKPGPKKKSGRES